MSDLEEIINTVYTTPNLTHQIFDVLAKAGHDLHALTPEILSPLDELHSMGREATLRLGKLAGFNRDTHILDIGCGIGGAARTLAHAFDCRVTGIDLTEAFCRTADELSRATGVGDRVAFRHGNALDLPFDHGAFDGAVMIHMNMNIPDKPQLFQEAARVVKPGGTLAMWEVCRGENSDDLIYPVPWSDDASSSFLVTFDEMTGMLAQAGFTVEQGGDALEEIMAWTKDHAAESVENTGPGIDVVIKNFPEKQKNAQESAITGKLEVVRVIARRQ